MEPGSQELEVQAARHASVAHDSGGTAPPRTEDGAHYVSVSLGKLVLMSICTLGLYQVYWTWKCWEYIRDRDGRNFNPFWRSVYVSALAFNYRLFWDVSREAGQPRRVAAVQSVVLGTLVAVCRFFGMVESRWLWWLAVASPVLLVPVQRQINGINVRAGLSGPLNHRFSTWNIATVVIGGLFLVLALIGTFLRAG